VTLVVDGVSTAVFTPSQTVAGLLAETAVAVGPADLVTPALDSLLVEGETVVVRHGIQVTLDLAGQVIPLRVLGRTVGDALVMAGLDPTGGIQTEPGLDAALTPGMTIVAKDVFIRVSEEEVMVPFDTDISGDPKLANGKRVVVTKGKSGSAVRVWQVLVTGGVESTKTLKSETVIAEAVTEVVRVGTKQPFRQVLVATKRSSGPSTPAYAPPVVGRVVHVEATAYTPYACGVNADWIAWRRRMFHIPTGWGVVAVDKHVIPFGTRLFVEGYGYAVAGDTGQAIKGYKMDVCFWGATLSAPTPHNASAAQEASARSLANHWGRKRGLHVTILGADAQ
jgi:3D (Asp-Asp-Asp) domain-containing protein